MNVKAINNLFKKQVNTKNNEVIVVKTETISCSNDHPIVYYRLKNGKAECHYCGKVFINE